MTQQHIVGQGFLIEASRSYHTRYHSSGQVINPTRRVLPDNREHSQATEMHISDHWDPRKKLK